MNAVPDMRGPLGLKAPKAKREPKHLARVAALPCVICLKPGPSEVHHCFSGRYSQRRASDRETRVHVYGELIGNCASCHGKNAEGITTKSGGNYGPSLIGVGAAASSTSTFPSIPTRVASSSSSGPTRASGSTRPAGPTSATRRPRWP